MKLKSLKLQEFAQAATPETLQPDEASIAHEEMMLQVLAQINDAERDS